MAKPKRRRAERASKKEPAEAEPAPKEAEGRRAIPWWLIGGIGFVVALVAVVRISNGHDASDEETRPVEIDTGPTRPERLRVRVVETHPHETDAFTQGLLWHEGHLYESTGLRGRSTLRKVDLASGRVLERRDVDPRIFAEGLARVGDRLYQLSWQRGEAHVWTLDGFEHVRSFSYEGEGWGLCWDGERLVMSDGSDRLSFRDPETFEVVRSVGVRDEDGPVRELNELECVDGQVWANVWQTDRIVRIDPSDGHVTATVDASGLLTEEQRWEADVLNGIAWIPERERFVLTGKLWPHAFEVELIDADE